MIPWIPRYESETRDRAPGRAPSDRPVTAPPRRSENKSTLHHPISGENVLRFTREVRSTKMNSLVGDLLSLTRKCSGAPVHERTRTRRIRRGGGAIRGRPKAVTRPATAGSTSRSVTDRQPHRHTHSCEARVEAPRLTAPSRALEAVRRGVPCPVEEDRRQGGLGGADESPPN